VRALLIVNPHATSTTTGRRDVIVRALKSAVDLEVVQTRYRGEATALAATAAADKFGLVITLGGDGTVNEAVNGLLGGATSSAGGATDDEVAPPADASDLPALAALPGGQANVFIRSLSLPDDPVEGAARLIADLSAGKEGGLGSAAPMDGTSPSTPASAWTQRSYGPSTACARTAARFLLRCSPGPRSGSTSGSPTGGGQRSLSGHPPTCLPAPCSCASCRTQRHGRISAAGP